MTEMGTLARTIMENKNYAHRLNGRHETWPEVATRTAYSVVGPYLPDLTERIRRLIDERKFVPGGRYLYASGRDYPQVNSCFLFRAADSRDGPRGWADTVGKATNALMTGGGIGVVYSDLREEGAYIKGLGGASTGPLALMKMINECGRYVRQGGSRRSAIWAGLRWNHPDIFKFVHMKDWDEVTLEGKRRDFSFPAPMDTTNVSVILDDLFFLAYGDRTHPLYNLACDVYWAAVRHMLQTGEPGFSVDVGSNTGENLRNACTEVTSADDNDMCLAAGTRVLTELGYVPVEQLVGTRTRIASKVNGEIVLQAPTGVFSTGVQEVYEVELSDRRRIRLTGNHPLLTTEGWKRTDELTLNSEVCINACATDEWSNPTEIDREYYMVGWLVGDGWFTDGFGFCFGSQEDEESEKVIVPYLRSKWGMGGMQEQDNGVRCYHINSTKVQQHFIRDYGIVPGKAPRKRVPTKVFSGTVVQKRSFLAGLFAADGSAKRRRQAGLASASAGLLRDVQLLLDEQGIYSHVGCIDPPAGKDHSKSGWLTVAGESVRKFAKMVTFGFHTEKQSTLESRIACAPRIDTLGRNVRPPRPLPEALPVRSITKVGPAEVFDISLPKHHHFVAEGMVVHNCNLSAVNMARIETKEEFHEVLGLVVPFLLCGSLYSKLPVPDMYRVREKNRRIGVGLMGVHEWLLKRSHRYGRCDELAEWMQVYSATGTIANYWADKLSISRPVATRSIAPTGTISIVAETTSGIEPIMAVAYKRRYLDGSEWKAQCVVDPTAKRLIDQGVDPALIEDSLTLAEDVERRMAFQSWLQGHVDHGISSTINLPPWGSTLNNEGTVTSFGNTLLKYLPTLRGITAYPDGARMGQPITRMPYHEAISRAGVVFLDGSDEQCPTGVCGV